LKEKREGVKGRQRDQQAKAELHLLKEGIPFEETRGVSTVMKWRVTVGRGRGRRSQSGEEEEEEEEEEEGEGKGKRISLFRLLDVPFHLSLGCSCIGSLTCGREGEGKASSFVFICLFLFYFCFCLFFFYFDFFICWFFKCFVCFDLPELSFPLLSVSLVLLFHHFSFFFFTSTHYIFFFFLPSTQVFIQLNFIRLLIGGFL